MIRYALTFAIAIGLAAPATAHQGFGALGDLKLLGRHGGGLLDGGLLGNGLLGGLLGGLGAEYRQERFEDQFADLVTDYDAGVADVTDFYNSAEYAEIVDDAERLVDRYDRFVTGVERSVDRFGNVITFTNEKIADLDDLLTRLQERHSIPAARLDRIGDLIDDAQEILTAKVELLTDRQAELQEDLTTYQAFQTSLTNYLDQIVTAGGEAEGALAISAVTSGSINVQVAGVQAAAAAASLVVPPVPEIGAGGVGVVPEPQTAALALLAVSGMWLKHRRIC